MTELTGDQLVLLEEMGPIDQTPDAINGAVGSFVAACLLDGLGRPDEAVVREALSNPS